MTRMKFGSDRQFAEAVPSARMKQFSVIQFIRKPAEALSPKGAEPRQLRGQVSGGSLRVGSSCVSDGVGRRYSAAEGGWYCATFGLGRRKKPMLGIAQLKILWFGLIMSPSARYRTVGSSAEPPRVGSHYRLMQVVAGGATPKDPCRRSQVHQRRQVHRRSLVRRRRCDVEDNGPLPRP